MSDQTDVTTRDIMAKVEAMQGALSDNQRAQVAQLIEDTVDARVASKLEAAKAQPAAVPGKELAGTRFERLGLNEIDVQMAHGILSHAKRVGISSRGPSEERHNLVTAIQERVASDDGVPMRAMDTTDTSAVIGVQYMTQMWEAATQSAVITPLIRSYPMASKTGYIPVFGAPPVPIAYPESTVDDPADYDTQDTTFARVSVTANKYGIHQKWSGEIEEESIVPFVAAIRERAVQSVSFYSDDIVMNSDTTLAATGNINSDDALLAANHRLVQCDGIRHGAIVDTTTNTVAIAGASIALSDLTGLRKLCIDRTRLTDWAHPANPRDFVYVINSEGYDAVQNIDELVTVDKYGANATVLTGEVAAIGRNPLLVTMAVPLTEADGKVSATPGNNTLNQAVAFNRNALSLGYLRQMTVETYRKPYKDQNGFVMFWRMGVARYTPSGAASGIEWVAVLRNW